MQDTEFASLPLDAGFLANLSMMGYGSMTPIQALAIPRVLEGRDIRAQAKTGSGKTAAFGIGLLQKVDPTRFHTQALVLCPTRELADQVSKELRRLARPLANTKILTLCGGTPIGPQFGSLEHPPQVVVGPPGRILKHARKGSLKLDQVQTLVLDEADRMLDMGFLDDISSIIGFTPAQRQTLLFSATYPQEILGISQAVQSDPLFLEVESRHDDNVIKQYLYEVPMGGKADALIALLQHFQPASCVVFCNRKEDCQTLANALSQRGFRSMALHGDLDQKERDRVLVQFSNGSVPILIATDVAARGLDIRELAMVVNYDLPTDPDIYTHRIGRTGRAGNEGLALSVFTVPEVNRVTAIERDLKQRLRMETLPPLQPGKEMLEPAMVTLCLAAGRKNKLRPGDILGALTAKEGLSADYIGKIDIFDFVAYVAITRSKAGKALKILSEGRIKGRKIPVRKF